MSNDTAVYNYKLLVHQLIEEGKIIKAAALYEKAYKSYQHDIAFLFDMAMFHHEYIGLESGLRYYDEILDIDSRQAGAYYGKAIIFEDKDDREQAKFNYLKAIEYDPDYYLAHLYIADIYDEEKVDALALQHLNSALTIEPENILAYNHLSAFYESRNQLEKALRFTNQALEIDAEHYLSLFNKGVILKKMGDASEAVEYYEKSIRANSSYPYSYLNLAVIYKEQNDFKRAEEVLTNSIIHNSHVSVLYYNRAIMRVQLNAFTQAKQDIIEAVQLSPSLKKYALADEELKSLHLETEKL